MIIYYFSATGNSLKAAIDIAEAHGGATLLPIREKMQLKAFTGKKKVGFVFPVYMGTLPQIVKRFLLSYPFRKEEEYFAIATYYTYPGVALSVAEQIIKKKGGKLNYTASISTVGSCLMEYEVPASKREKKLRKAACKTDKIIRDLKNSIKSRPRFYVASFERMHEWLFHYFFKEVHTRFTVESTCIGCGKCRNVCLSGNITIINNRPCWGNNCLACHACVHWCPKNAIHIGKSQGRLPYHHPEIRYQQILDKTNLE